MKNFLTLKYLNLKTKILIAFTIIAFFSVIVGVASYSFQRQIILEYQKIALKNLPTSVIAANMRGTAKDVRAMAYRLGTVDNSEENIKPIINKINDLSSQYENLIVEYNALTFIPNEKELFDSCQIKWKQFTESINALVKVKLIPTQDGLIKYQYLIKNDFREHANTYFESMNDLVAFHQEQARLTRENAEKKEKSGFYASILITSFSFLCACILGLIIGKTLSQSILNISSKLNKDAENVDAASIQISKISDDLASSTQEQSAAIQQTSAAVTEISTTVTKNAESALNSQQIAKNSQLDVEEGNKEIKGLSDNFDMLKMNIQGLFASVNEHINKMEMQSNIIKEIENKTSVINDIVFQTKLLSFNASVEAARAGADGKGFSVVAVEIGNLAQMSSQASNEISLMLLESIQKFNAINDESKTSIEQMVHNSEQQFNSIFDRLKSCESAFQNILLSNKNVVEDLQQICNATIEQDKGMQEISQAIFQLDKTTHSNSETSEKAAATAKIFNEQLKSLKLIINELLITVRGQ